MERKTTMATALSLNDSFDCCMRCSSNYNRIQPSLCQCKHCSESFCFDCMKEHNDDLHQKKVELADEYNALKQLVNDKKELITNETIKTKQQLSEWLKEYIDDLIIEREKIDMDIDREEKQTQKFFSDIESELQSCMVDIQGFTKTNTFNSAAMEKLFDKLKKFKQQMDCVIILKDYDLPSTMPKYTFKVDYSSKTMKGSTELILPVFFHDELDPCNPPNVKQSCESNVTYSEKKQATEGKELFVPGNNYFGNRDECEPTSYTVNCMATDGINIMYSSIKNSRRDLIAYCYLNINDVNYGQDDPYRPWFTSRIVDMIWWKSIEKFICATKNGIFTVTFANQTFKIIRTTHNHSTNIHVAANTNFLWVYTDEQIMIYDITFELVQSMDFNVASNYIPRSFCITDNVVAFLVIRSDQRRSNILQVQFYDNNMRKIKSLDVGACEGLCMIRTVEADQFIIVNGEDTVYFMTSEGGKETITIEKDANCVAVINRRNIVFSESESELQLINVKY
ncbi:unnamed protein product [Adineta steineri]|uniref:Uncharacterized protein n=1 Tax=Adineta steineri TaxID=433720 RepID=A0A819Q9X5_9BILA|nr:unnamed protein product [Adineta steineri]